MEFLVLSVQSSQNIDLYKEITRIIAKMGCHICTLQGQKLATEHVLIGMVSGNWNTLTRLETELNHFKREKQLELFFKRTKQPEQKSQLLPYSVEVLALDQMGMLHHICHFFSEQNIVITHLKCDSYTSSVTHAPMCALNISLGVQSFTNIAELREQFMLLCEDLSIDGIIEPDRR